MHVCVQCRLAISNLRGLHRWSDLGAPFGFCSIRASSLSLCVSLSLSLTSLSLPLSACLAIDLLLCLSSSVCLSFYLGRFLSGRCCPTPPWRSVAFSVSLSLYLSLSMRLSVSRCLCLSLCLFLYLSLCLSLSLSVLFVWLLFIGGNEILCFIAVGA